MRETDRIIAEPRGSAEDVFTYLEGFDVERPSDVHDYVDEVFRVAPQVGVDPSIVIAQASHETDVFRSHWWKERLNPAGMGVTGDPRQNAASPTFRSGAEAARAQIAHLQLYATGTITAPLSNKNDPRYTAYIGAYGNTATARTIADLANRWAVDDEYAAGIVRHGNAIFDEEPQQAPSGPQPVKIMVNGEEWDGRSNVRVNGVLFRGRRQTIQVNVEELNVRTYAHNNDEFSPILGQVHFGDELDAIGWVSGTSVSGEDRWWVLADHSRVWSGGTSQKPL